MGPSRETLPDIRVAADRVHLLGVISVPPGGVFLLGPAGYEDHRWPRRVQVVDLEAMEEQLGYPLLPYTVLLDHRSPVGYIRKWQPNYGMGAERHRAYAVQWFGLALALVIFYIAVSMRRCADRPHTSG